MYELVCMVQVVATIMSSPQDPTLAENSRRVFSPLIDFIVQDERIVIKAIASEEQTSEALKNLGEKLKVGSGFCESLGGLSSWDNPESTSRAHVLFEPSHRSGQFLWSLITGDGQESVELRQIEPGVLRLVYQNNESVVVFNQRKDKRCTLVVDSGREVSRWQAASFDSLMFEVDEIVPTHFLSVLERFFDVAPLSPYSPETVQMALEVGPLTTEEARSLDRLIEELEAMELSVRELSIRELKTRIAESASTTYAIVRRLDSMQDGGPKDRLVAVLGSFPRRQEACRLIKRRVLYRNLGYLLKLMSSGQPARSRLEALTGRSMATVRDWTEWIKQHEGTLQWDEGNWKYK